MTRTHQTTLSAALFDFRAREAEHASRKCCATSVHMMAAALRVARALSRAVEAAPIDERTVADVAE